MDGDSRALQEGKKSWTICWALSRNRVFGLASCDRTRDGETTSGRKKPIVRQDRFAAAVGRGCGGLGSRPWDDSGRRGDSPVRATALCDDDRLVNHLKSRPGHPFVRRFKPPISVEKNLQTLTCTQEASRTSGEGIRFLSARTCFAT